MNPHEPSILIVEDTTIVAEIQAQILQSRKPPYIVRKASNGREALDLLQTWMPDLILLDLNMPVMDGRELLRSIKADEKLREIPVVVLTVSESLEDRHQALELGAANYIVKPEDLAEYRSMLLKVAEYMTVSRAQR